MIFSVPQIMHIYYGQMTFCHVIYKFWTWKTTLYAVTILLKEHVDNKWVKIQVIVFGKRHEKMIILNGKAIHNVDAFSYFGNYFRPINSCTGDIFKRRLKISVR